MVESLKPEVHVFHNLENASRALADTIVKEADEAVKKKGRFLLALCGGNTPRFLYSLLASEYAKNIEWSVVHLFWGDERYVPKDHPESNFAFAYHNLISKVSLPAQNIHRINTEGETPERAAESYEKILREFFEEAEGEAFQTFDVTLLGMGKDGHTASVFPESLVIKEKSRWIAAVDAPPSILPQSRITLTLPALNTSGAVFFLVSGAEKSVVLRSILEEPDKARRHYPAAMVQARRKLVWYVDEEAFKDISSPYYRIVKV